MNNTRKNPRTALKIGDVIVSSVGTIGNCAVVTKEILPSNSDRHVGIIRIEKKYLPNYVSTFLVGKYGRFQTLRESTGNVQLNLFVYKIRQLKIADLSSEFQNKISETVIKAHAKLEESKALYAEAENLLLDELGLRDWSPSDDSISVKSFAESFAETGRLDAEYYQPKYDELFALMKDSGYQIAELKDLIEPIKNGIDNREYVEEGIPYIRVGDVKQGRINLDSAVKVIFNEKEAKDVKLKIGDVLFTRKGSFGNAAVVKESDLSAVISSEIMLLRLNKTTLDLILPEYLSLFLNSKAGFLQSERNAHGVAFYSISQDDLAKTKIVIPSIDFQKSMKRNLNSALEIQKQSKQLLEIAKRAVETAIEDSEETAAAWIEEELKAINFSH